MNDYNELLMWISFDLQDQQKPHNKETYKKALLKILDSHQIEQGSKSEKLINDLREILNDDLSDPLQTVYIRCFFSYKSYRDIAKRIRSENFLSILKTRAKTSNYLQALDFFIHFSNDLRNLNQIDRACFMTRSLLDLFMFFKRNKVIKNTNRDQFIYFFATTVVLSNTDVSFKVNFNSKHIIVMIGGQAYYLQVIQNKKLISVDNLKQQLDEIKLYYSKHNMDVSIGGLFSASRKHRYEIKKKYYAINKNEFNLIENAIFILCLDTIPYQTLTPEKMFSGVFRNRLYGHTQLIIGPSSESGVITSYLKINGKQALKICDLIYQNALKMDYKKKSFKKSYVDRLDFKIPSREIALLNKDTTSILHDKNSIHTLCYGKDFFKKLGLDPTVTIYYLIMLAVNEMEHFIPVVNHAVSIPEYSNPAISLDWLYISINKLHYFLSMYHATIALTADFFIIENEPQNSELKRLVKTTIFFYKKMDQWHYTSLVVRCERPVKTNHGVLQFDQSIYEQLSIESKKSIKERWIEYNASIFVKAKLMNLIPDLKGLDKECYSLRYVFNEMLQEHKEKISRTKVGLSPTFLVSKQNGEIDDNIVNFFLDYGEQNPAYRNYLFRAYRNTQSVDIMISSLTLPPSIQTLGRPGTISDIFNCFGLHIFTKETQTDLVFIPNNKWVNKLDDLVVHIHNWIYKLELISYFSQVEPEFL